jgi:HPt (histidine-containing phosphotransfer) domain-containing protein
MARIETIERAVAALRVGALDPATAEAARREAHKLTGSLGTFGIPEGTRRARALELALEDGAGPADATRLEADAAALRRIVEESLG